MFCKRIFRIKFWLRLTKHARAISSIRICQKLLLQVSSGNCDRYECSLKIFLHSKHKLCKGKVLLMQSRIQTIHNLSVIVLRQLLLDTNNVSKWHKLALSAIRQGSFYVSLIVKSCQRVIQVFLAGTIHFEPTYFNYFN